MYGRCNLNRLLIAIEKMLKKKETCTGIVEFLSVFMGLYSIGELSDPPPIYLHNPAYP